MTMRINTAAGAAIAAATLLPVSTATALDALSLLEARGQDDAEVTSDVTESAPSVTETSEGFMFRRVDRGTYVSGGYLHEFGADFSGGGSVSVNRVFGGAGIGVQFHPEVKGSIGVAWGGDWYRFEGDSALSPSPGAAPWSDIHAITALASANWQIDPRWSANLGLRVGTAGEADARIGDSIVYGGNLAVSYSFSREFTLGAGALVQTQIEDRPLIIPLLVVYWQVTDSIVISNVLGPEAYPTGAGLEAAWRPDGTTELSIGSRYEVRRFRLDDTGDAVRRQGIGEDVGLPIWARATWRLDNGLRLDLVGGVSLMNEYSLDDRNGNEISSTDLDPAPFIAGFVSWRF